MIPNDSIVINGENCIANEINRKKINEIPGELIVVEAIVTSRTRKSFKPKVDKAGQVKNMPLQMTLEMKKNARVMLTVNLDVCDNLTNGCLGSIFDFILDSNGNVKYVLVIFDDPSSGEAYRKSNNYENQYPGLRVTPIKKEEFEYQLKEGSASTATALNFPLKLAWGTTCHKIQVLASTKFRY